MSVQPRPSDLNARPTRDQVLGCLLGGAVGDALGAPIEFASLTAIRSRYGPAGLRDFDHAYGRRGAITDDTQMTLFTAEGLIRAQVRARAKGIGGGVSGCLHQAYLRWLKTQGERPVHSPSDDEQPPDGWLIGVRALHDRRAPGSTCLSALRTGRAGSPEDPLNASKGCGGVMRVAPAGLWQSDAFQLGATAASLTHGHPTGFLAAGAFAAIIAGLFSGQPLDAAIDAALVTLRTRPHHEETLAALERARALATSAPASPETVEQLGGGWIAEEALAIGLFCALRAESFEHGVLLAVNHSGDSDSTGSICGNLLGAQLGAAAIPSRWLADLELRAEIETLAADLWRHFGPGTDAFDPEDDRSRYPGW